VPLRRKSGFLGAVSLAILAAPPLQAQQTEWPELPRPAPDAPNVLVILTDDVGFGASSTFGGAVETPTFDDLAREGVRYSNFTTTGICSPTRAALLTGRNHNTVNVGNVVDVPAGDRGYTSVIPQSAATGARLLADAGYGTAMFGKHHLTPRWELGPTGPFDRWPTGLGFQHFYGFMMGDTNQFVPALFKGTNPVEPPKDDPDYILDKDLADNAISWIRTHRGATPKRPFFVYYAPGTAHAPLQAPADWIEKYRGRFDAGWDVLREQTLTRQKQLGIVPPDTVLASRPSDIPEWASLSARQKRVYARQMEVFAAALSHADHQIGRVIDEARKASGGNLLVVYIQGDNGGSAESGLNGTTNEHGVFGGMRSDFEATEAAIDKLGGPDTLTGYSSGWAFATNTPFPWVKQVASHFGATRNGMVISWPGRIGAPGAVSREYHHIIDIMPTVLEAAKISLPKEVDGVAQIPFDGISMTYSFSPDRGTQGARRTQHFVIWDNMGIYHDGWMASSVPAMTPWKMYPDINMPAVVDGRVWELYRLDDDFGQARNVADRYPEKLAAMKERFLVEAGRFHALPVRRMVPSTGRPNPNAGVDVFRFSGPVSRINPDAAPPILGNSFEIDATVTLPSNETAQGTVLALGGKFGGLALFLDNGRPSFEYNFFDAERTIALSTVPLVPGTRKLKVRFDREEGFIAPATVTLWADGVEVGKVKVPQTTSQRLTLDEGFDIGSDTGTAVSKAYQTPNTFSGDIDLVELRILDMQ
jgi:arylsulfatase